MRKRCGLWATATFWDRVSDNVDVVFELSSLTLTLLQRFANTADSCGSHNMFNTPTASSIAQHLLPIDSLCNCTSLPSYSDANFLLTTTSPSPYESFVLKIHNEQDSTHALQHIEAQHAMLLHLAQHGIPSSAPLAGRCQRFLLQTGTHIVRALSFIQGTLLANVTPTPVVRHALGRMIGRLTLALTTFDHPGGHRGPMFDWDIRNAPAVVRRLAHHSDDATCVLWWCQCCDAFYCHPMNDGRSLLAAMDMVEPFFTSSTSALPTCMLHGDLNEHNILVDIDTQDVVGILDVGDLHYGWRVADLGVACTYQAGMAVAKSNHEGDLTAVLRLGLRAAADVVVRWNLRGSMPAGWSRYTGWVSGGCGADGCRACSAASSHPWTCSAEPGAGVGTPGECVWSVFRVYSQPTAIITGC